MVKNFKSLSSAGLFIFGINFLWEIIQMPLYQNNKFDLFSFIFMHLIASLGDVLLFIIIYLVGAMIFRSLSWFLKSQLSTYLFSVTFGFLLAVLVEKYALATGRWQYNELMPIVPLVNIGLSPALQLIILPLLTITFFKKIKTTN